MEHMLESLLRVIVGGKPTSYKAYCTCSHSVESATPEDTLAKFRAHVPKPWEAMADA